MFHEGVIVLEVRRHIRIEINKFILANPTVTVLVNLSHQLTQNLTLCHASIPVSLHTLNVKSLFKVFRRQVTFGCDLFPGISYANSSSMIKFTSNTSNKFGCADETVVVLVKVFEEALKLTGS